MKIIIVSDTHRKDENLKQVIARSGPLDMLIHLGDAEGSEHMIATWVNEGCDLEMILGNNEYTGSGGCTANAETDGNRSEYSGSGVCGGISDRSSGSYSRYSDDT